MARTKAVASKESVTENTRATPNGSSSDSNSNGTTTRAEYVRKPKNKRKSARTKPSSRTATSSNECDDEESDSDANTVQLLPKNIRQSSISLDAPYASDSGSSSSDATQQDTASEGELSEALSDTEHNDRLIQEWLADSSKKKLLTTPDFKTAVCTLWLTDDLLDDLEGILHAASKHAEADPNGSAKLLNHVIALTDSIGPLLQQPNFSVEELTGADENFQALVGAVEDTLRILYADSIPAARKHLTRATRLSSQLRAHVLLLPAVYKTIGISHMQESTGEWHVDPAELHELLGIVP